MNAHKGIAQLSQHQVLIHLANNYASAQDALYEFVDNSIDARKGKVRVWVVIEKHTITIIDDGVGMTSTLSPEEVLTLENYKLLMAKGLLQEGDDVRHKLTPKGKSSLQYLAESIGFSGKYEQSTLGQHGIGFWGWIRLASEVTVVTSTGSETNTFHPPTRDMIQRGDLSYTIVKGGEHKTPWNSKLEHGTTIILKLKPEIQGTIQPGSFANQLGVRFGAYIHEGILQLSVVDYVTAKSTANRGTEIRVLPPRILGSEILIGDYDVKVDGTVLPYSVHVRFMEGKGAGGIQLRIAKVEKCFIHEVPGLKDLKTQLSSQLVGYIDLPSGIPLNTAKDRPMESKKLTRWINHLHAHVFPKIFEATKKHETLLVDRRFAQYAQVTAQAVTEALKSLPYFDSPEFEKAVRERIRSNKPTKKVGAQTVRGTVMNEHSQGVPNVKVTVSGHDYTETLETGTSGGVLFGMLPSGKYTMAIEMPDNTSPISRTEYPFWLENERQGYGGIFVIHTGSPAPEKHRQNFQQIVFRPLSDPMRLWDASRLKMGILVINSDAQPVAEARDSSLTSGNWSRLDEIVAQCVAGAMAELQYPSDTRLALTMAIWLSTAIKAHLGKTRRR